MIIRILITAFTLFSGSILLGQRPVIQGGVNNAASFDPKAPSSPGMLASVFGANLASQAVQASSVPLPTRLDDVVVQVNGIEAPLLYVSPTQINLQIPWDLAPGHAMLVVSRPDGQSTPISFILGEFSPGVFTLASGIGQAVVLHQDGAVAGPAGALPGYPSRAAEPGDILSLLGTGFGQVNPPPESGTASADQLRRVTRPPTILVGGRPAELLFAGLSPQFVGVNQINFVTPRNAYDDDQVALQAMVGGVTTTDRSLVAIRNPNAPPRRPPSFDALYTQLQNDLIKFNNTVDSGWDGTPSPVLFSAEAWPADAIQTVLLPGYYEAYVLPFLDGLQDLGVKAIKVQMGFPILYEPFYRNFLNRPDLYQEYLDFYKTLIHDVHERDMKFISQAQSVLPSRGAHLNVTQYYRSLSFEEYQAARSAFLVNVAQQLQPDYLLLQTEPDNEARMTEKEEITDMRTNLAMLRRFVDDLQAAGHEPAELGSGFGTWMPEYGEYARALAAIPGLDLVDIHLYPINDRPSGSLWMRALEIADIAHANGKDVGVSESWLYKVEDDELDSPNLDSDTIYSRDVYSFWEPLDQQFLRAMTHFAHYKRLSFVNAAYSVYFFTYLNWGENGCTGCRLEQAYRLLNDPLLAAFRNGTFTETGRYYSRLIQ